MIENQEDRSTPVFNENIAVLDSKNLPKDWKWKSGIKFEPACIIIPWEISDIEIRTINALREVMNVSKKDLESFGDNDCTEEEQKRIVNRVAMWFFGKYGDLNE